LKGCAGLYLQSAKTGGQSVRADDGGGESDSKCEWLLLSSFPHRGVERIMVKRHLLGTDRHADRLVTPLDLQNSKKT
jgi:hypothetical protein